MIPDDTQSELEQHLGVVPSFIEEVADPAVEHSWAIMRDLELGETELSEREKALVSYGVASAIQCPYCTHFHGAEAEMIGASADEKREVATLAGAVRYFSTVLHGAEVDMDDFAGETTDIVNHLEGQQAAPGDD
jgi:AhpD family alkylhydroperoxidase